MRDFFADLFHVSCTWLAVHNFFFVDFSEEFRGLIQTPIFSFEEF